MPARVVVIFDVDGTLVQTVSLDDNLYGQAVRQVIGPVVLREKWSLYTHVSDAGILMEVCSDNGLDYENFAPAVRTRFGELFRDALNRRACEPLNGAVECLQTLMALDNVGIGIATGGWGHTAKMKIEAAGFGDLQVPFSSSDDHYVRTSIMEICRRQIRASNTTIYVGDGEWDMKAAADLGWRFVGVGERLVGRCRNWVPDLTPENLFGYLHSELGD